ncbi:hypothetical protein [Botrimarina sp.]|uniref:hypothetical protein n=1 Tax=Botrimarina sp. TaxID=2795802 RepID=UPI0032EDD2C0
MLSNLTVRRGLPGLVCAASLTAAALLLAAPAAADTFSYSTEFDNLEDFNDFVYYNEQVYYDDDRDGFNEFGLPNPSATPEILTPDGEWTFLPDEPEPELDEQPKPLGGTGVLRLETGLTHVDSPNYFRGGAGDNAALLQVNNPTGESAMVSTTWTQFPRHSFENNTFFSLVAYGNKPYTTQGFARELSNGKAFPDDYVANVAELDDAEYYEFRANSRSSEFSVVKRAFNSEGEMVDEILGMIDLDPSPNVRNRLDLAELSLEGTPARENTISLEVTKTMVPDGLGGMVEGLQFDATLGVWYGNVNENEGVQPVFTEETFTAYDASGDLLMGEYFGIREQRYDPGAGNWFYDFLDFDLTVDVEAGGLAGDFNSDGTVDAADYTVWRDGLGTTYTQADYDVWAGNYGASAGSAAAVPEPGACALLMAAAGALAGTIGRRRASL